MLNDKTPKGYSLSKEQTKQGTKYERVFKKDAKKNGKVIYQNYQMRTLNMHQYLFLMEP